MKRLVYKNDEGGISIVTFAPNSIHSEDEAIKRSVPPGTSYHWIDSSDLPDRKDRDCWVIDDVTKKVKVCPTKLAEKQSKKNAEDAKKAALLSKLGLTEEEAKTFKKL